ncbi:hypothetical protein BDV26DRAFT_265943 [Aspergillus bertholletiae]|uniref:Uncharacterized protein n=1 Tax=Aspergillus bertholletiae TaxID=1226010 RepID=A0A5N7B2J4_9EURO|nr:hypothetical protein BDV26DRAFT_265943 [Aspergillus bertholletiae]
MRGAALSLLCASQWDPYSRSLELGMYLTGLFISCIYFLTYYGTLKISKANTSLSICYLESEYA